MTALIQSDGTKKAIIVPSTKSTDLHHYNYHHKETDKMRRHRVNVRDRERAKEFSSHGVSLEGSIISKQIYTCTCLHRHSNAAKEGFSWGENCRGSPGQAQCSAQHSSAQQLGLAQLPAIRAGVAVKKTKLTFDRCGATEVGHWPVSDRAESRLKSSQSTAVEWQTQWGKVPLASTNSSTRSSRSRCSK